VVIKCLSLMHGANMNTVTFYVYIFRSENAGNFLFRCCEFDSRHSFSIPNYEPEFPAALNFVVHFSFRIIIRAETVGYCKTP